MFFLRRRGLKLNINWKELQLLPYFVESMKAFIIILLVYASFYRLSCKLDPNKDRSFARYMEKLALTIAMCLIPVIRWIYVIFIIILHLSLLLPSVQESIKQQIKELEENR